jgi:hypothetical protein
MRFAFEESFGWWDQWTMNRTRTSMDSNPFHNLYIAALSIEEAQSEYDGIYHIEAWPCLQDKQY